MSFHKNHEGARLGHALAHIHLVEDVWFSGHEKMILQRRCGKCCHIGTMLFRHAAATT